MPPTIDYIPITNIRFDSAGSIIKYTDDNNLIHYPAQNADHNNNVIPSGSISTVWSDGKTIFELQSAAFNDLTSAIGSGTSLPASLPASIRLYSNAIKNIIDYNKSADNRSKENSYTNSKYPQIVFYNKYNNDVDYDQYENMVKTRDFMKAKMDYINDVPGTVSNEQKGQHLNAIYMNTLVSILATSLLYFIFIHLRY
jgi:hypothetical protein